MQSGTHDFLLTFHSNHRPISHRFRDKRRCLWKIANFSHPRVYFTHIHTPWQSHDNIRDAVVRTDNNNYTLHTVTVINIQPPPSIHFPRLLLNRHFSTYLPLQCSDIAGWVTGRASSLLTTLHQQSKGSSGNPTCCNLWTRGLLNGNRKSHIFPLSSRGMPGFPQGKTLGITAPRFFTGQRFPDAQSPRARSWNGAGLFLQTRSPHGAIHDRLVGWGLTALSAQLSYIMPQTNLKFIEDIYFSYSWHRTNNVKARRTQN